MRNPWRELPRRPPFILPMDAPYVDVFNRSAPKRHRVELDLLPDPFNGHWDAPVVVLLLNPGVNRRDFHVNARPAFRRLILKSLTSPTRSRRHSFLAPGMVSPGTDWWLKATRHLIELVGRDRMSTGLLTVEFFPYHSLKYAHSRLRLPSQCYTFGVVRRAIERDAAIVLARGAAQWFGAIPELADYPRLARLRTARSTDLSPRNVTGSINFAELHRVLK